VKLRRSLERQILLDGPEGSLAVAPVNSDRCYQWPLSALSGSPCRNRLLPDLEGAPLDAPEMIRLTCFPNFSRRWVEATE